MRTGQSAANTDTGLFPVLLDDSERTRGCDPGGGGGRLLRGDFFFLPSDLCPAPSPLGVAVAVGSEVEGREVLPKG